MATSLRQLEASTILDAAIDIAQRYVSAYRETLLTDSQIVAAIAADARSSGFSSEESAEIVHFGFTYLEQNHHPFESVT